MYPRPFSWQWSDHSAGSGPTIQLWPLNNTKQPPLGTESAMLSWHHIPRRQVAATNIHLQRIQSYHQQTRFVACLSIIFKCLSHSLPSSMGGNGEFSQENTGGIATMNITSLSCVMWLATVYESKGGWNLMLWTDMICQIRWQPDNQESNPIRKYWGSYHIRKYWGSYHIRKYSGSTIYGNTWVALHAITLKYSILS